MMNECKTIACLGPEGSFSAMASEKFCPGAEIRLCRSFNAVFEAVLAGEADAAALPIENSTQGGILQNLDLLERHSGLYAVSELILPVELHLVRREGVRDEDVRHVYSHEQAIGQCMNYLQKTFPDAQYIYTPSTAVGPGMLDEHSVGIVGAHMREAGFVFSEENIADEKCNQTHFLLVRKGKQYLAEHSKKVFVCLTLAHRPGALLKFLQTIDSFGLNLTKIESRPIPSMPGAYRFFIEFEGDIAEKVVQYALDTLENGSRGFRFLGAY